VRPQVGGKLEVFGRQVSSVKNRKWDHNRQCVDGVRRGNGRGDGGGREEERANDG
jgi:hypothetical protein